MRVGHPGGLKSFPGACTWEHCWRPVKWTPTGPRSSRMLTRMFSPAVRWTLPLFCLLLLPAAAGAVLSPASLRRASISAEEPVLVPQPPIEPGVGPLALVAQAVQGAPANQDQVGPQTGAQQQGANQGPRGRRDRRGDARTYLFSARLEDAEALAKGAAMLERVLEAAGGLVRVPAAETGNPDSLRLPLLTVLPGLRYQQLETSYAYLPSISEDLQVHHLVPRSVHFGQGANGYLYSEFVRFQDKSDKLEPEYRREVIAGAAAWFEVYPQYGRTEPGATRARQNVERELVFGLMPHGLAVLNAKVAWMEQQVVNGIELGVYLARLPSKVRGKPIDEVQDLLLYVDENQARVIQVIYHDINPSIRRMVVFEPEGELSLPLTEDVLAGVRASYIGWRLAQLAEDTPERRLQAEGEAASLVLPASFKFAQAWTLAEDYSSDLMRTEVAAPLFEPLDPAAVARPWQTNQTYAGTLRADFWDPPVKGPEQPKEN
jgi:hypothetical protein